jgi:hypothetical protein
MTVRAHQNALRRLGAELCEALPGRDTKGEGLAGRIHVMEVQIDDASVVAAHRAASAGLFNQGPLDLLETPRDSLAGASFAAPSIAATRALATEVELDKAMPPADA